MEFKNKSGKSYLVYIIAAIAATGGLLFGFDTGVISGVLLFIREEWSLSPESQGIAVSSVLIGAMIGAIVSGKVADKFGRKTVIIWTAFIFFIGSVGTALAPDLEWLIFGRIIIGIAIGVASFAVPLYISEVSPTNVRGALVSMNQLAITIGIVVSYVVDAGFANVEHGWRYMFGVGVLPALILGIGMFYMPKTPRWLISKNKFDEAETVLKKIEAKDNVQDEINEIKNSITEESGGTFKDLLLPWLKPALIIGIGMMFIQQCTGINTVIYYAPTIFQKTGFESEQAAIAATSIVGVINVLFTIVSIVLIDKIGRRPLLLVGLTGMTLSLGVLGLAFMETETLGASLKYVAVASTLVYIASFAVSLGPICWLLIAEIYPLKIRGVAMSIATFSNWAFNFLVALSFPILLERIGPPATFWIFALLSIGGWIFCYCYVPETKGHSLEKIEEHWKAGKHPRELA
ncbi:MAG: sugar porter family MFS transporter [Cyanobacteriota bacterium]